MHSNEPGQAFPQSRARIEMRLFEGLAGYIVRQRAMVGWQGAAELELYSRLSERLRDVGEHGSDVDAAEFVRWGYKDSSLVQFIMGALENVFYSKLNNNEVDRQEMSNEEQQFVTDNRLLLEDVVYIGLRKQEEAARAFNRECFLFNDCEKQINEL